jgi:TRAP transporter 4TM/12TM fusion protein
MKGDKGKNPKQPIVIRERLALIIGVLWSVYTLAYLSNLFFYLGVMVYPLTHRAISTGLISTLVLLMLPPFRKKSKGLSWYETPVILAVVAGCGYVAFNANELAIQGRLFADPFEMVLGIALFLAVVEAARRTVGWTVPGIVVGAFFYAVYSDSFPGFLRSTGFPYSMAIGYMYLGSEGFWGIIVDVVATIVAGFIIFGGFLKTVGASQFFTDLALALAGSLRGGAAKAAIVASTFFGTISGSIAANVATTGQITIPLMKKTGYGKNFAGAVESTASTGGMFTPPVMGAAAFLIAEFLQISYWQVCVAAALPALAFYVVLFVQVDLEAARLKLSGLPKNELPSLKKTLKGGWHFMLPFVVLIILLGVLSYSVQTAILYTLASLIIASSFKKESRLTFKGLVDALASSARGMMPIIPLCAAIGILVGAIEMTGAGTNFTSELLNISRGNLFILLLMAAFAAFLLGMGMTAVSVYLLTVVLLAPALINAGVEPVAAHFFLFYFGCLSFITPPVCVGAYIAAGISGGSPMRTGFYAVQLGSSAFLLPWGFVLYPGILMIGTPLDIGIALFLVLLGTSAVGIACAGRFFKSLPAWERTLLGISGLALFIPNPILKSIALGLQVLFLCKQFYQWKFQHKPVVQPI